VVLDRQCAIEAGKEFLNLVVAEEGMNKVTHECIKMYK